jgi:cytochrome c oxidase subunit 2
VIEMNRRNVLSLAAAPGLSIAGGGLVALLTNFGARAQGAAEPRVIAVTARRWVWIPEEISVKQGETVQLEFTAPEVVMGFYCPDLKLRQMIIPGQKPTVRWTADRAGNFDFVCDVFCGDGHEGMAGRIVVA